MSTILLQDHVENIAKALGKGWTRSNRFNDVDSSWRAVLEGPNDQELFISTTWAAKGRLYIGGSIPHGTDWGYGVSRPEITVDENKSAQQVANDITRRLLPDYQPKLAAVLKRKAEHDDFEVRRNEAQQAVAKLTGGRINGEMVFTGGWDVQVSGPDSIRLYGHCLYLTLEQLKKISAVAPELFKSKL